MNPSDDKESDELRLRAAGERLNANAPQTGGAPAHPDEKLFDELHVYQIELEMQNEALRVAQGELVASHDRYVDLYDFAPVGYLTLDRNGMIEQLNLTAATLFGVERKDLLQRRFISLVTAKDQGRWMTHLLNVKKLDCASSVELAVQRRDGTVFQAELDCQSARAGAGEAAIRISLSDISLRKAAEAALLAQIEELQRFNRTAINRELAMIELKRQVNALSCELGRAPPYALDFADAPADPGDQTNGSSAPAEGAHR